MSGRLKSLVAAAIIQRIVYGVPFKVLEIRGGKVNVRKPSMTSDPAKMTLRLPDSI
jgi:hypothetical protein